jgi:hypothetical protein
VAKPSRLLKTLWAASFETGVVAEMEGKLDYEHAVFVELGGPPHRSHRPSAAAASLAGRGWPSGLPEAGERGVERDFQV